MSEPREFWVKITSFDKVEMGGFRYSECEISIDPNCAENYDDFKNAIHLIKYDEFKKIQKENEILREALEYYASVETSTEYAYSDGNFCFMIVAEDKFNTLAREALEKVNKK